ncbi:MAG TPA: rhodanese-like domain-containing protein [Syntrophobacteria bacterium]|nr:rhodanese-like domain-containing protein [Syntrophobacteria bacterium]
MPEAERISPQEVRKQVKAGTAFLVCAYDEEDKFRTMHLEGAISFDAFKSKLPSLSKDQKIIFYCA